jgi:hypothetical protein
MSHLGSHARYELELVGEEPEIIDWYVKVVETFAEFGHTGESAEYTTRVLEQLLRYKNLTPLTDDPAERSTQSKKVNCGSQFVTLQLFQLPKVRHTFFRMRKTT